MKLSDVIALIGAGYTKAEIDAMENAADGGNEAETPKQETATEVKPEAVEQKADPNTALLDAINNLTAIVQKNNVRDSKQPAEVEQPKDIMKEADDVLINLYNS